MLTAAKKEVMRARQILRESRVQIAAEPPCRHCRTVREELVEKRGGKKKDGGEPGPLVKVLRMSTKRCRACKEARAKHKVNGVGFSCKRDKEVQTNTTHTHQ